MANADWPGYVGMATGIFGAGMGFLAYRRTNQIKALDLRLELRKGLGEARESITTIRELMASAAGSRRANLAARGLSKSGNMVALEQSLEADRAAVEQIAASILSEGTDFAALSEAQLETELINAHKIKTSLAKFVEKYRSELAADADARTQMAHQATAMAAARMGQKK